MVFFLQSSGLLSASIRSKQNPLAGVCLRETSDSLLEAISKHSTERYIEVQAWLYGSLCDSLTGKMAESSGTALPPQTDQSDERSDADSQGFQTAPSSPTTSPSQPRNSQASSAKRGIYVPPHARNAAHAASQSEPLNNSKEITCRYWWLGCCYQTSTTCDHTHRLFNGRVRKKIDLDLDCDYDKNGNCFWPARLCHRRHKPGLPDIAPSESQDWLPVTSGALCKRCDMYFANAADMAAHQSGRGLLGCKSCHNAIQG